MSDLLRVALVAEGPTDRVVIEAALRAMLAERLFVLQQLQPEESMAFGGFGSLGSGWTGVYRWCSQMVRPRGNGSAAVDILHQTFDLLILHLDADVAGMTYASGGIRPDPDGGLPCASPCPPPSDTTDRLRAVLLDWCGIPCLPERAVVCMPSKSTEAWVVAALYPQDLAMTRGIECWPDPESRLGQQPVGRRIAKKRKDYQARADDIAGAWPRLVRDLGEARRFQAEVTAILARDAAN